MGFFELLLIGVVALLVVGPERMPEAVRSVAVTVGRFKRMFNEARDEVEKQIGADEIRQQLHNEAVLENIAKMEQQNNHLNEYCDQRATTQQNVTLGVKE